MARLRRRDGVRSLIVVGVALVIGCTPAASSSPSPSPTGTAATSTPVAGTPAATATVVPTELPSASPSPTASPAPAALALSVEWVAETIVDRVRMRSLPTIGPESERFEPLLNTGEHVYVIDGPVAADGYQWYQVLSLAGRESPLRSGWLAVGSREGERWVRDVPLACRAPGELFEDFAALANLGSPGALACFRDEELRFLAQVTSCVCTASGPAVTPRWLASIDRTTYRLTAPDWLTAARREIQPAWDPAEFSTPGLSEPSLPNGVYQVTGHYDHAAAATCRVDPDVGGDRLAQIGACRMTLVITAIEPFGGIDGG